jgi:hypothetical protein
MMMSACDACGERSTDLLVGPAQCDFPDAGTLWICQPCGWSCGLRESLLACLNREEAAHVETQVGAAFQRIPPEIREWLMAGLGICDPDPRWAHALERALNDEELRDEIRAALERPREAVRAWLRRPEGDLPREALLNLLRERAATVFVNALAEGRNAIAEEAVALVFDVGDLP